MKIQRAWNGKLNRIDKLMSWLYDKDILTKTDKSNKDRLFRKYYRWYNDGDVPRGMSNGYSNATSMPTYLKKEIEVKLETELTEFISKILKKYNGKYSRTLFRLDNEINKLNTVISVCDHNDHHGLTTYWYKDVRCPKVQTEIAELKLIGTKFKKHLPEELRGYTFSFAMENIEDNQKTRAILEIARDIKIRMLRIGAYIRITREYKISKRELYKLGYSQ